MDCKTFVMCVCVCGGERRASSCLYQISIFTLCRFTVSFPWIIHKSCAPLSAQSHTLTRVQAQCADIAACQPISVNADNMCLCCLITRPGVKVSGQEELMKKKKKEAKSHSAGLLLSLYLAAAAGIDGTCGAAISTGRFVGVEPMPVLRWVQLKTDAALANGLCMCACVW